MEKLFFEPGEKLKLLAIVIFILASLISVGVSLAFFLTGKILFGVFFLTGGPIASWVISLPVYGFGSLIARITNMERMTRYSRSSEQYKK